MREAYNWFQTRENLQLTTQHRSQRLSSYKMRDPGNWQPASSAGKHVTDLKCR